MVIGREIQSDNFRFAFLHTSHTFFETSNELIRADFKHVISRLHVVWLRTILALAFEVKHSVLAFLQSGRWISYFFEFCFRSKQLLFYSFDICSRNFVVFFFERIFAEVFKFEFWNDFYSGFKCYFLACFVLSVTK